MITTTLNASTGLLDGLWQHLSSLIAAAPKARTRCQEASEVREMARGLQATDPGFAADLFAAADRHEAAGC